MKRSWFLLLLLALTVSVTACIQLKPTKTPESDSESSEADVSESDTETDTDVPVVSVPDWVDAYTNAADFFADTENTVVDSTKREYSYEEMVSDLEILAERYPNHFSYRSFGKSVAGRDLYVAVLGNPDAEHQIMVSAGLHGREYLTPLLVMKQMEFYLTFYENGECNGVSYSELFENCCFYMVPMSNPDGIMLSQAGIESLADTALQETVRAIYEDDFRKDYTSQTDIDEYLKFWKANANGVDLNRNFDSLWENYRAGEKEPCHKSYKGPAAASEPETRALAELTDSLENIAAVICIHSQGEVLYWNCGQDSLLSAATRNFTEMVADRNGYDPINEQNNDASYSDWCALERGLIAITVETGKGTCPLFIDKFEAMWFDNFDLLPLSALYFEH